MRAFTLIELLVVIAIIGLLIAAIAFAGGKVMYSQKVKATQNLMRNLDTAIDQFATEAPLGQIYNRQADVGPDGTWDTDDDIVPSFGKYPPYTLEDCALAYVVEPTRVETLTNRLWWDLGNGRNVEEDWVSLVGEGDGNDDIRALYTYLKVFTPGLLDQLPEDSLRPLEEQPEFANSTGMGTVAGNSGVFDIFGIHDAWDVPMDYFLMVRMEWAMMPDGSGGWRVAERVPVFRSRGISREKYDTLGGAELANEQDSWIFSEPFRTPPMEIDSWTGDDLGTGSAAAGWVRLKALNEDYPFVPEGAED